MAKNNSITFLMYVMRYGDLFKETNNPIYAWRAFENALRLNCKIPDEVLSYILSVAHKIVTLANNPPTAAQRPIALAKALKLHKKGAGQGSAFTEYSKRSHDRKIALDVIESEYYDRTALDYSFEDISKKYKISKSKVRRLFLAHQKRWRKIAERLIEAGSIKYNDKGKPTMMTFGTADDMLEGAAILDEAEYIKLDI